MKRINCRKCEHYYITWDQKYPYGCRAMGFKTASLPSLRVFQSTGHECLMFSEKKISKEQ